MTASSIPHPPAPGHEALQNDINEDGFARHGPSSEYLPERDGETSYDKYLDQGAEGETEKKEIRNHSGTKSDLSSLTTVTYVNRKPLHVSFTARLYCHSTPYRHTRKIIPTFFASSSFLIHFPS